MLQRLLPEVTLPRRLDLQTAARSAGHPPETPAHGTCVMGISSSSTLPVPRWGGAPVGGEWPVGSQARLGSGPLSRGGTLRQQQLRLGLRRPHPKLWQTCPALIESHVPVGKACVSPGGPALVMSS